MSDIRRTLITIASVIGLIQFSGCTKKYSVQKPIPTKSALPEVNSNSTAPSATPSPTPVKKRVLKLEFTELAEQAEARMPFKISLKVVDETGQLDESYNESVGVLIATHPKDGSEFLSTNKNVGSFKNGVASFDEIIIEKPGEGYTLMANSKGLIAESKPINIVATQPKEMTLILNGKKIKVKFVPPNTIVLPDGDRFPVYDRNIRQFSTLGRHFSVEIISPTEIVANDIAVPMKNEPLPLPSAIQRHR